MGSEQGRTRRAQTVQAAQKTAPTRLVPRTAYVAQVELGGEWYDTGFVRSLVKAAETRAWNPAKSMGSARGMWFSETTTIAVEQSQVTALVERGWAKDDNNGGYYGTDALLDAIEEAGGLPAK